MDLIESAAIVERFTGSGLAGRIARLERALEGATLDSIPPEAFTDDPNDVLAAAANLKRVAGQVNVMIHAVGMALCLPRILEPGEVIESLSLGAGNTGKSFDLESDRRIAEFKFIRWRGGPEPVRKATLFKDFYKLAEFETSKRKFIYLLGTDHALSFLHGRSSLRTVLREHALQRQFFEKYGDQYSVVRDYYLPRAQSVSLVDVSPYVPNLVSENED